MSEMKGCQIDCAKHSSRSWTSQRWEGAKCYHPPRTISNQVLLWCEIVEICWNMLKYVEIVLSSEQLRAAKVSKQLPTCLHWRGDLVGTPWRRQGGPAQLTEAASALKDGDEEKALPLIESYWIVLYLWLCVWHFFPEISSRWDARWTLVYAKKGPCRWRIDAMDSMDSEVLSRAVTTPR